MADSDSEGLAQGPGLRLSNQLPGGTNAGHNFKTYCTGQTQPPRASAPCCSVGITGRHTHLRDSAVYPHTVPKNRLQSPTVKRVPEPLGPHWLRSWPTSPATASASSPQQSCWANGVPGEGPAKVLPGRPSHLQHWSSWEQATPPKTSWPEHPA